MTRIFLSLILALSGFVNAASQQASGQYDALIQQGNSQLQAGKPDQALSLGQEAAKIAPERWQAHALNGGALMSLKRYEEAADQFSDAIRAAPSEKQPQLRDLRKQCIAAGSPSSQPVMAPVGSSTTQTATQAEIVLWKSIENSSRQDDFKAYLQQYPHGTFVLLANNHLAELNTRAVAAKRDPMALLKEGRYDDALNAAEAAINADPSLPEPYYEKASILITRASVKAGKIVTPLGCEEAYQKYLLLSPNGAHAADVRNILASIGAKVGRSSH